MTQRRHPLSRRDFLRLAALAGLGTLLPAGLARAQATPPPAPASACIETPARILDLAATAEALATTFYYRAIQSQFFARLPQNYQTYFRAALDQERQHYLFLTGAGGRPLATSFYFPPGTFGFDDFVVFVATIERLETDFLGAYLAAARRYAEMGQPVLAATAGQILGIEAEHRIIGRELKGETPPPPNNLCFERVTIDCPEQTIGALSLYLNGGAGYAGPLSMPSDDEMVAAIQGVTTTRVSQATALTCQESAQTLLDIAATAEALGITFYYGAIQGRVFGRLSRERQWYFQAALDEERNHLLFLRANGAAAPPTSFHFPAGVFDDLPACLALLDTLENAFIGAYLVAIQRLTQLGQPLLAQTAAQILGVEAEHRILGRIIAGAAPANDLTLERAPYGCLAEVAAALAPFLQGNAVFTQSASLPSVDQITTAVDRFGCAAVATASYRLYFPHVAHNPPTRS